MDVQVTRRATWGDAGSRHLLLQVQYVAWMLVIAPIHVHVHVVLTVSASGRVMRHEEQMLVGKMVAQLPIIGPLWWWGVHVVAPCLLHTLWLPILRAAVASGPRC